MGNTLKNYLKIGAIGLAAAGLTVLLGGCARSPESNTKTSGTRTNNTVSVANEMQRVDVIRKLTHAYVGKVKEIKKRNDPQQAEYERRLFALEINDSLQAAGYISLVQTNGAYVSQPNERGLQLLDGDDFFAKDYFYLITPISAQTHRLDVEKQLGPS
jgi:hypothetical protein